jgi:hypothetical protein
MQQHIVENIVLLIVTTFLLLNHVTARPENNAEVLNGQFYDEVKQLLDKKLEENNQIEVTVDDNKRAQYANLKKKYASYLRVQ